jgi:hypothetical protein
MKIIILISLLSIASPAAIVVPIARTYQYRDYPGAPPNIAAVYTNLQCGRTYSLEWAYVLDQDPDSWRNYHTETITYCPAGAEWIFVLPSALGAPAQFQRLCDVSPAVGLAGLATAKAFAPPVKSWTVTSNSVTRFYRQMLEAPKVPSKTSVVAPRTLRMTKAKVIASPPPPPAQPVRRLKPLKMNRR